MPGATKTITLPARTAAANGPGATSGGSAARSPSIQVSVGRLGPGPVEQGGVDVDADGGVPAAGELDGDAPGAAAGVEDPGSGPADQPVHQGRLAVHVLPGGGQGRPLLVVLVRGQWHSAVGRRPRHESSTAWRPSHPEATRPN